MLHGVTVVDSDGVVMQQARLVHAYAPRLIATTPPTASYRYFMPRRALPALARQMAAARRTVLFLGAGDFHHLTAAMLLAWAPAATGPSPEPRRPARQREAGRLALIVVDAHPEWSLPPPGYLHCGSWLPEVLAMRHVGAVALVGVGPLASQGLLGPALLHAVAPAVRAGRLRVYPACQEAAAELSAALPWPRPPLSLEDGIEAAVEDLAAFVGPAPVYLSLDKDVVRPEDLPGRWSGGLLEGRVLMAFLRLLLEALGQPRLMGVDVCGEYEPALPLPALDPVAARHEAFNLRLLELVLPRQAVAA